MNINLLKLTDKAYKGIRIFKSLKNDLILCADAIQANFFEFKNPKFKFQTTWNILSPIRADIPFPGFVVEDYRLKRNEVIDWLKEHLNYGKV